jgi:hypothetical protein
VKWEMFLKIRAVIIFNKKNKKKYGDNKKEPISVIK